MPAEPVLPDDKLVYANWVRLDATPYDVSLQFGYRMGEGPPKQAAVQLVMTWEHAKDVLTLLGKAVEEYDKNVGAIRDFQSVVTPAVQPAKAAKPPPQRRKRK